MRKIFFAMAIFAVAHSEAQNKKPLDHTVYDRWQSIGERKISNNGNWIIYTVEVQEGDGDLIIQSADARYIKTIPRGYNAAITEDSRFVIVKIKPLYTETRQARIKKKSPDEMPKDSLAIIELGKDIIVKTARVKSYKFPEKNAQWVAWQMEKPLSDTTKKKGAQDSSVVYIDSLKRTVPQGTPEQEKRRNRKIIPPVIKDDKIQEPLFALTAKDAEDNPAAVKKEEGTDLVIYNLQNNIQQTVSPAGEYLWSENGNILLVESTPRGKDSLSKAAIAVYRTKENRFDTILKGGNDFRNFAVDKNGYQVSFVAERDSSTAALQKFYKLWYWRNGQDTAVLLADKNTAGMPIGWGISENATVSFSKSGKRLLVGTAPLQPAKDTSLIDIDLVKVDVWNYKDDYLQTMQLKNLDKELKRNYLATIDVATRRFVQLGDKELPNVIPGNEGDGEIFIGTTDVGKRIAMQWEGKTRNDIYVVNPSDGSRQLIKKDLSGQVFISPAAKYVLWYDAKTHQYFTWKNGITKNISSKIATKLYDEEFDMPDDPSSYGLMSWTESDLALLVYDRFDIWQLDPDAVVTPINITAGEGRKNKIRYRYIQTDPEEKFVTPSQELLLSTFNENSKYAGFARCTLVSKTKPVTFMSGAFAIGNNVQKAKNTDAYVYTKETFSQSPDIYLNVGLRNELKLSSINPQQAAYLWGSSELFKWKAYDGKEATGIVYKPDGFDPQKKYPAICYFYEKLSDGLYQYIPPAPTPSRLNISFFVSRGYLVFVPDISYTTGHPGKSAYNYIVSGIRSLIKKGWVDSTKTGLQGQSWGGYQTAYVITQTKLFSAAWAGAPVSNMTSAYGGIRWESGMNRQFQYEHTQSRIGATLWEKPQLYIENSPLFQLPKVTTPLVIMHNDNDGAVPWYQGIELFTGLRRLNKPVWLLNYNGEAHNLVERKNRKDIQIREQQFFDWLLKEENPPQWLSAGVPATMKGKTWGLDN